jgi:hypothetical protein
MLKMGDEVLERNKNLNRGFRKLNVWREAVELYAFEKKVLGEVKGISFKIKDQVLTSDPQITQIDADYEKEEKSVDRFHQTRPRVIVAGRLRSIFSL